MTQKYKINTDMKVQVIEGKDFDHKQIRFKGYVPSSTNSTVYHFKKTHGLDIKLFHC